MINIRNACLSFGTQDIFENLSFTIEQKQRIGLVGLNGSGKSTLLKAIAGKQKLDDGSIAIQQGNTIAYLPQDVVFNSDKSIFDEAFSSFEKIHKIEEELRRIEPTLENNAHEDDVHRYAELHEQLNELEPDRARAETQQTLDGLGFSQEQLSAPVSSLSVGWKMRVVLAKMLLKKADFYLFDEPTNHLDIVVQQWFLKFLQRAPFGFILICHERYFLDKVCDKILELDRGKGIFYDGNYSDFEQQKEQNLERLEAAYIQQQKDIKRKKETINRFRASASKAKMAQSMMKQLEKIDLIKLPPSSKNIKIAIPVTQRTGKTVLTVKNVSHSFGPKKVFENVSFEIERGEKVAIIAPNGAGKTTLFNIIAKKYDLQNGTLEWGYNAEYALFDQDQSQSLNPDDTVVESVEKRCRGILYTAIRTFLGSFLFSSNDVKKKTKVLSGGEKNRVGMIGVLLQGANTLLLDEPTNHLDIPSKDVLLKALQSYDGTIIFVSHDQGFVNKLATRILELSPTGVASYYGNYDEYIYQKEYSQSATGSAPQGTNSTPSPQQNNAAEFARAKEIRKIEHKIARCEKEIKKIEHAFAELTYGTKAFEKTQGKLAKAKQQLQELNQAWEETQK